MNCKGCGAPLVPRARVCEYCRSVVEGTYEVYYGQDLRGLYGNPAYDDLQAARQLQAANLEGQAMAAYYNAQQNASVGFDNPSWWNCSIFGR